MPAAIGGSLTINFDAGISSVTAFGTTITTSGNSIENISADDGTTYTGTFVLNSGYTIDTIVYSASSGGGTLSGYTENDFSLVAGVGGIYGTLTITTKEASNPYSITIKNKEGIKLLTKDKTIEFTDDVKVTIDESLLGGGESGELKKFNFTLSYNSDNAQTGYMTIDNGNSISLSTYTENYQGNGNTIIVFAAGGMDGVTVTPSSSAEATLIKAGGTYTPSIIVIKLLADNAVIDIEGQS